MCGGSRSRDAAILLRWQLACSKGCGKLIPVGSMMQLLYIGLMVCMDVNGSGVGLPAAVLHSSSEPCLLGNASPAE